ncbi:MAG: septation protein SepH [Actinomycetia bacterium]|nr:septation protein SepH [Actinomycetes bacterium]
MDAALTPREIQARIRAGESAQEVAQAAGVSLDSIVPFAEPVLAEREHMAAMATGCQVRRSAAETGSHRPLADVIGDRLTSRGVFPEALTWDAWRGRDRLWTVRVAYESGSAVHEALFTFDQRGRFSVPANPEARWLIGDVAAEPKNGRRRRASDPDEEPTLDLHDRPVPSRGRAADALVFEDVAWPARESFVVFDHGQDALAEPTDFTPATLAEVDGVFDIVPTPPSDLDVLYDMLAEIDEDSVNLYADITGRIAAPPAPAVPRARPQGSASAAKKAAPKSARPVAAPASEPIAPEPAPVPTMPAEVAPEAAPAPRKSRKRAVVPSAWDDILFGARKAE